MSERWREILKELDIEPTETRAPSDHGGTWFQLRAVFGTTGFLRLLTDGSRLALELAPPRGAQDVITRLGRGGWEVGDATAVPLVADREFPAEEAQLRDLWIAAAALGDAIRDDDASDFASALDRFSTQVEEPGEEPASADETKPASAFEEIGAPGSESAEEREPMDGAFAFALEVENRWVDVVLGFDAILDPIEFEGLERTLVRNLRAKFDVNVRAIAAHEVGVRLERRPETKLALRVTPDEVVREMTVEGTRRALLDYLGTIESLAGSGIDPLVFLGVRRSERLAVDKPVTSGLEEIGGDEPRHELMVDDRPAERDAEDETNVVLSVEVEPERGDPLVSGRYDDPRLKGPDATTSLVDVVLRHPGYSDKSIGQVLSILLSIEYARCLELAERAPIVIAWGVARDRAQTMKTVIEGAGGKVYLAEPGEFGEE